MFDFRIAGAEEAAEFHGVMLAAYDNLENKDLYVCDDLDYVSAVLEDERKGFGVIASVCSNSSYISYETDGRNSDNDAFDDDLDCCDAAGVLLVTFPKLSEENLARDVSGYLMKLADDCGTTDQTSMRTQQIIVPSRIFAEDLERDICENTGLIQAGGEDEYANLLLGTAHIETTAVRPEYQGNRLQTQMIEYACDYMKSRFNNIKYVCATVSPDNIPSLKSFAKCGFNIAATKEKYGGKQRHILVREINNRA